jgi:hypothetical protein
VERYRLGAFANGSPTRLAELARQQWLTRAERSELSQRCRTYIRANHAPDLIAAEWLVPYHLSRCGSSPVPRRNSSALRDLRRRQWAA